MAFENFATIIITIIEQMLSKEGRYFGIKRSIDLLLYQLFILIHNLSTPTICNKVKMQTKGESQFLNRLEFIDNINTTFTRIYIERGELQNLQVKDELGGPRTTCHVIAS
jgi:hypothetical protein